MFNSPQSNPTHGLIQPTSTSGPHYAANQRIVV